MSEEQQNPDNATPQPTSPSPSKRLVTGVVSGAKPRLLSGTEATVSLRVAMTPEQEAAIAKAKAQREAEDIARQQEEARFAAEQARYEEEMKAYQEYQASLAAQQAQEQQVADATSPIVSNSDVPAPMPDAAPISQDQATTPPTEQVPQTSPAPTPTGYIPPTQVTPPIPTPTPTPTSAVYPPTQGTYPTGKTGTSSLFTPTKPTSLEDFGIVPLWKKKVFYIPVILVVLVLGAYFYSEWQVKKDAEALQDKITSLQKIGANDESKVYAGTPDDVKILLDIYKNTDTNWQPTASILQKIMAANTIDDLPVTLLDDMRDNYNKYISKVRGTEKIERLYVYIVQQKNPSRHLRDSVVSFIQKVPDDFKAKAVRYSFTVMTMDDFNYYIDLINESDANNNNAVRDAALTAALDLMKNSDNKASTVALIRDNYNAADDKLKMVYIRLMGRTGDKSGLDFLKGLISDKNTNEIALTNIIRALGTWPDDESIALMMQLKDDPRVTKAESNLSTELKKQMLSSLRSPGRERDMAKLKPMLDYLSSSKDVNEIIAYIRALSTNSKADKWAYDILGDYLTHPDDKISYEAEQARGRMPETPPIKKEGQDSESTPSAES